MPPYTVVLVKNSYRFDQKVIEYLLNHEKNFDVRVTLNCETVITVYSPEYKDIKNIRWIVGADTK